MNLLEDPWIGASFRDGTERRIRPAEMANPDVVDIVAHRPDFRGALYQFLIGLLQTTFAPREWPDWMRYWKQAPSVAELDQAFAPFLDAFELDSAGPAFMQDFDLLHHDKSIEIARLLIDAPGEKTLEDNKDHFNHHANGLGLCPSCASTGLYTLQINAPGGGAGHRVSLRGGGPMTTLRLPLAPDATLWQKVWGNVVPHRDAPSAPDPTILPWLAPTRTSQPKGGTDTTPETVHSLQAYWSMPRRVRLNWSTATHGTCGICGLTSEHIVTSYRAHKHGTNYTGAWMHPLTPYSLDPKQENLPISIKGQPSGIGYRHWFGWTLGDALRKPANVVSAFAARRLDARLWCFGYDIVESMKARCWYDGLLPLPSIEPEARPALSSAVVMVLGLASHTAFALKQSVGNATTPDGTCDPAVPESFWQRSETFFYEFLKEAVQAGAADEPALAQAAQRFLNAQNKLALDLFDEWVLNIPPNEMKFEKVVQARVALETSTWKKDAKVLRDWIKSTNEVTA